MRTAKYWWDALEMDTLVEPGDFQMAIAVIQAWEREEGRREAGGRQALETLLATCKSNERILTFVPATYGHVLPTLREAIAKAETALAGAEAPEPTTGLREALEAAVDFIATGDFIHRVTFIGELEKALAAAEAAERKPTCPICDGDHP